MMRAAPPVPDVLDAEHPGLAEAVGDGRPRLRIAAASSRNTNHRLRRRADCRRDSRCHRLSRQRAIELIGAVAPVGQRRVVVDADHVDRGRRPQRIERKPHLLRRRIDDMRAVFGPVGAVSDDGAATDNRLHVGRKLGQPRHRRVNAGRRTHAREISELRTDEKRIDTAGIRRELRVVQHHAADSSSRRDRRCRRTHRSASPPRWSRRAMPDCPGAGSQVMRPRQG